MLTKLANKYGLDASEYEENMKNMLLFTTQHYISFHEPEHLDKILKSYGFALLVERHESVKRVFEVLILREFIHRNNIDTTFYDKMLLDGNTCVKLATASKTYQTAEGVTTSGCVGLPLAAAAGKSGTTTYVTNFQVEPTFDIVYWTGQVELDNYIKWSIIFAHNLSNFSKMSHFQKLIMLTLCNYLVKKADYIKNLYRKLGGTRYRRENQPILGDYLENFESRNLVGHKMMTKYNLKPFLLELNGMPGVGKSDFVDFLASFMHEIFPFYEESDMLYTRVNDKYWNGYKQQPMVLFDDQNQNRNLKYDLDNEIIALGSGKLVHPPMAFDKDTKFSSIFVIFTTNKRIIETTKADKGAVDRRLNVRTCKPLSELGTIVPCEFGGEKWLYKKDVEFHPFNLQLNDKSFMCTIFDFIGNLYQQRSLQFSDRKAFYYMESFRPSLNEQSIDNLLSNALFVDAPKEVVIPLVKCHTELNRKLSNARKCKGNKIVISEMTELAEDTVDEVKTIEVTGTFTFGGPWNRLYTVCQNLQGIARYADEDKEVTSFTWSPSPSYQNEILINNKQIIFTFARVENGSKFNYENSKNEDFTQYVIERLWVYDFETKRFFKPSQKLIGRQEDLIVMEFIGALNNIETILLSQYKNRRCICSPCEYKNKVTVGTTLEKLFTESNILIFDNEVRQFLKSTTK